MKNHNYGLDVRRQVVRKRKPAISDKKDLHLSPEGLPQFFSMQMNGEEAIYACSSLAHAFAASCKHAKRDGFDSWVPCVRDANGFYMPDIQPRSV